MADAFASGATAADERSRRACAVARRGENLHAWRICGVRNAPVSVCAGVRTGIFAAARAARSWSAALDAIFLLTPIAGALLVWLTFVAGRTMAGPLAGAMAAVLIAASPPMLYQVVQPMNDVTTAALWMATFAALLKRRWALAGVCCGLALLVRPNSASARGRRWLRYFRDQGLGIGD